MNTTHESIFSTAARTFFKVIFGMLGLCVGIIPVILLFGALGAGDDGLALRTHPVIEANADGSRRSLEFDSPLLLNIRINGVIGLDETNSDMLRAILEDSVAGPYAGRVKGILLSLDTPGGGATDADRIYRLLMEYKERHDVPIIALVDGYCFSGGVYVAAAADEVYGSASSAVGSVGVVVGPIFNVVGAMEKLGLEAITITSGESKDTLNPTRPWLPGEGKDIQSLADSMYQRFLDVVVAGRPRMSRELLVSEYGARVFSAADGVDMGFLDGTDSSWGAAVNRLAELAGVDDADYQVIRLQPLRWIGDIFSMDNSLFHGKVTHELRFPEQFDPRLNDRILFMHQFDTQGS